MRTKTLVPMRRLLSPDVVQAAVVTSDRASAFLIREGN
jgi:hypothetical protein